MNNTKLQSITVVGGGTAGLIAALILNEHLTCNVTVIYSESIGSIGVGEGSTEHFEYFMQHVGIEPKDILTQCDSVYKTGLLFKGWGEKDFLHSVVSPYSNKVGQYLFIYGKQISSNNNYLYPKHFLDNKIEKYFIDHTSNPPIFQYNFNTFKLIEFLKSFCIKKNISIIEDNIENIEFFENGYIKNLVGKKNIYESDFYIDATGFKRILISKMGAKWISYKKFLKTNAAITFLTEDEDEYNMWTLATAMDYGWLFKIPVWGRSGNGYIFNDEHITEDQAKIEIENKIGKEINVGRKFKFDPGCLDKSWINNCCAIGLSSSFVEPLEASSIGTTIQQSFLLMHKIMNYNQNSINEFNKSFNNIMENIRDFIALHYLNNKKKTNFWEEITNNEIPESLDEKLQVWKYRLPIKEDFADMSHYLLFYDTNFTLILNGLNLFDRESIYLEYQMLAEKYKNDAEKILTMLQNYENTTDMISHKKFLSLVRGIV